MGESVNAASKSVRAAKEAEPEIIAFGALSDNQLLTYTQAAKFLEITPQYLRELKSARKIKAVEIGYRVVRFRVASLNQFVKEREVS